MNKNVLHSTKAVSLSAFAAYAMVWLSSCQDEDFGHTFQEVREAVYLKSFEEKFGKIDPNQDFNLASRGQVTVTVDGPSEVKVYAKAGHVYKIVADYSDVTGTQTLGFDVCEGVTDLVVSDGSRAVKTTVGGSVSLTGAMTRGVVPSTYVSAGGTVTIPANLANVWTEIIPELGSRNYTQGSNLNNVTCNFTLVSNGAFYIYPTYWSTRHSTTNSIGIYYVIDGIYYETTIFRCAEGYDYLTCTGQEGNTYTPGGEPSYDPTQIVSVTSTGICIDLPVGTVFGMYLDVDDAHVEKYYSEADLNSDPGVYDIDNGDGTHSYVLNDKGACHACIFDVVDKGSDGTITDYQFLGFEDWTNKDDQSDFDMNDMVFMMSGNLPTVTDEENIGWILAYEDLGNSLDWDYNDIVALVSHISGQSTASFTPLAAAGTLPSYIKYNGQYLNKGDKAKSEIHYLFDSNATKAPYFIVNGLSQGGLGTQVVFNVASDFSMTDLGTGSQNLGGLTLEVENASTSNCVAVISYDLEDHSNTPEVLCLPAYWYTDDTRTVRRSWPWPTENSAIDGAYPRFAAWVADKNTNQDWYKDVPTCPRGDYGKVGDANYSQVVSGTFDWQVSSVSIATNGTTEPSIVMLQSEIYMAPYEDVNLSDLFYLNTTGSYSISSSDESVVSPWRTSNAITGMGYGTAVITIRVGSGNYSGTNPNIPADAMMPPAKRTIIVHVVKASDLEANDMEVTLDETGKKIGYSTSSTGVVSYEVISGADCLQVAADGTITPLALGTATVRLSQASDGTYAPGSVDIKVSVMSHKSVVITVDPNSLDPNLFGWGQSGFIATLTFSDEIKAMFANADGANLAYLIFTVSLSDPNVHLDLMDKIDGTGTTLAGFLYDGDSRTLNSYTTAVKDAIASGTIYAVVWSSDITVLQDITVRSPKSSIPSWTAPNP